MKVLFSGGVLECPKKHCSNQHSFKSANKLETRQGVLPFMSIPSIAFLGKLSIPLMPAELVSKPQVNLSALSSEKHYAGISQPEVKYRIYPQDPLVTKPAIRSMKGDVQAGPSNNRVTVSSGWSSTKPDRNGDLVFNESSKDFEKTNAFYFVNKAIRLYEKALGRRLHWAFDNALKVDTRAGKEMNACYNRLSRGIKLYYFDSPSNPGETLYTSKMADVINHEAGHAVLDGLRPSYMGWSGAQGVAVHESFADATAMLVAMSDDKLLDRVIEDTDGNIRKENLIASLAEQMGKAVYGDRMYLRNALNRLKLSHFTSGKVPGEPHIVGMFFDAVFYDILSGMYKENCKTMQPKEALRKTRDEMTQLFARAAGDFLPPGNVQFFDLFVAMAKADKIDFKGKHMNIIIDVLTRRELYKPKEETNFLPKEGQLPDVNLPFNSNALTNNLFSLTNDVPDVASLEQFVNNNKKQLELPSDKNYKLESAYKNDSGETFLQLKAPIKVDLPDYEGEKFALEVFDGLTLAFDKNGKLFYKGVNNTTQEEIDGAIKDCMKSIETFKDSQSLKKPPEVPSLFKMNNDSNLLVKAPLIKEEIKPVKYNS